MRKAVFLCLALVFISAITGSSLAWVGRGTREISISGLMWVKEKTVVNGGVRLGYFLSKRQEIEGNIRYDGLFHEGESENTILYECGYSYNLIEDKLPLFISGGVGRKVERGSGSSSCFVLNIGGGLKAFIRDEIALRVDYRLRRFFTKPEENRHDITLGFSYFFRARKN